MRVFPTDKVIDPSGWHRHARWVRSANYNARPAGAVAQLIVVHCISLPRGCYGNGLVERFFVNRLDCSVNPSLAQLATVCVSSHFFIARTGRLTQFVSCGQRAWHAGVSEYQGRPDCNNYSIGVELEGRDDDVYTAPQYAQLAQLCAELIQTYAGLSVQTIVGHQHIARTRKADPGHCFDWSELCRRLSLPGQDDGVPSP